MKRLFYNVDLYLLEIHTKKKIKPKWVLKLTYVMWKNARVPVLSHSHHPLIMAHRGDSAAVPENTLPAFEEAAQLSVDCIETDVRLTKDDEFVFFHDPTLDRTTNGQGLIGDHTLQEIQELDAGYSFLSSDGTYPYRGKGLQIQTLAEVLTRFPTMRFNMDIKDKDPKAPRLLAELLHSLGAQSRVMVGSFHQSQIHLFRQFAPDVATSAGPFEVLQLWRKSKGAHKKMQRASSTAFSDRQAVFFGTPPPYYALQIPEKYSILRLISPDFIEFAHFLGIAVQVWTINDQSSMIRLLSWGVDGIFTDRPKLLIGVIDSRK